MICWWFYVFDTRKFLGCCHHHGGRRVSCVKSK
jgi:hypothetical protein